MIGIAPTTIRSHEADFSHLTLIVDNANVTLAEALKRRAAAEQRVKRIVIIAGVIGSVVGIGTAIFVMNRGN